MARPHLPLLMLLLALLVHLSTAATPHTRGRKSKSRPASRFVGGVYAMSNNATANTLVVYGRFADGTLSLINPALPTGGTGAVFNTGIFDPLFSSFSVVPAMNNRFILAVNAGSNSVSVFLVRPSFALRLVSVTPVPGFGPTSIAVAGNLVYVVTSDADGEADSLFEMEGLLSGFRLTFSGQLIPIPRSRRRLGFRPASIHFTPDRRTLIVTNPFSGFNAVSVGSVEEIFTFRVFFSGRLSRRPVDVAASTQLDNPEGRALPGAIGMEVASKGSEQLVFIPEFRLTSADGMSDVNDTGSVSIWRINRLGKLSPVQLDLLVGPSTTGGESATCWVQISPNVDAFWTANTLTDSVSAFSFSRRSLGLLEIQEAATGVFPVDMWLTADGKFLYQLFSGEVGAFSVDDNGISLTEIQRPMNVPVEFAQGIVAI